MALSRTSVHSESSAGGYGTSSWTTGSFVPPANSLLVVTLALMSNGGTADPSGDIATPVGGGLTFTQQTVQGASNGTDWAAGSKQWTAPVGGSPSSMTLQFDCGAVDVWRYRCTVVAYTGYNTSTPIGATVNASTGVADGSGSITLSGAPATDSEVVASMTTAPKPGTTGILFGTGWTQLYELFDSDDVALQTQVRTGSTSTTVAWDDVAEGSQPNYYNAIGCAVEVKIAAAGGSVTGTFASTLGRVTIVASGAVTNHGTFASTLGRVTMAASGNVGSVATGTFASTLGPVAAAFSGQVRNVGSFASTLGPVAAAFSGQVRNVGTFASTLGRITMAANGIVGDAVSGTFASTLGAPTMSFSGQVIAPDVTGTFASTLGGVVAQFSGNVAGGGSTARFRTQIGAGQ